MTQIDYQPIFDYIDNSINPIKEGVVEINDRLRNVETAVSNLVGENKAFREELLISNHRTSRLEMWAKPIGKKVKIPLEL